MVKIHQLLAEMQGKISALEARVRQLEHVPPAAPSPSASATALSPAPPRSEISEEVMLVIAAAVAAYLGERAHIRVVRLVSTHAWAQQGRVSIQASHRLV
jgi:methylmalonyl-CoA carboxyltransferase large subunit